jgi:hypothetical protein
MVQYRTVLGGLTPGSPPVLDTSETRVQTTLDPGLPRLGTITPRNVHEIQGQPWMIGCEVLDRSYANYDTYKEYLVPLGIRRVRLQGGWATTEHEAGRYDFRWLDRVIDDALARGLEILLETSYGNPSYPGGGGRTLNRGFPVSDSALEAWDRWVEAMAVRYRGRVSDWGMWNEPDGNDAHTPEVTADFNIRTAAIIKRVQPDARIAGAVIRRPNPEWAEVYLRRLVERRQEHLFHWFVYHGYTFNPDEGHYEDLEALKAVVRRLAPHLQLWQGEAGTESEYCLGSALSKYPWTELTQAKWVTRRMLGDLGHDVPSSIFTISDYDYSREDEYQLGHMDRYGLIKTDRQFRLLKVKPSYYAVQNVVSVFDDSLQRDPDLIAAIECRVATAAYGYRKKATGQPILTLWNKSGIPSNDNSTVEATVSVRGAQFQQPVWVDVVTGGIHEIPSTSLVQSGDTLTLMGIPLYDAPALVLDRALVMP